MCVGVVFMFCRLNIGVYWNVLLEWCVVWGYLGWLCVKYIVFDCGGFDVVWGVSCYIVGEWLVCWLYEFV